MLLFRVLTYKVHVILQLNKYNSPKFARKLFSDSYLMNFFFNEYIRTNKCTGM